MENKENKLKLKDLLIIIILLLILIATNTLFTSLELGRLNKNLERINKTETINTTNAYSRNNEIESYNITDLTGTSWKVNSITCSAGYGQFNVNTIILDENEDIPSYGSECTYIYIGYSWGQRFSLEQTTNSIIVSQPGYLYEDYTITFNSGNDITNTNLINWLQSNATQLQTITQLETPIIIKSNYNEISWNEITNASNYEIYKDNTLLTTTNNTNYTITSLGTYQVKAIGNGVDYSDSELSNSITISQTQLTTPQTTLTDGVISWSAISNADSYTIYKDNNILTTTNNTSYSVINTGNYQVQATTTNTTFFSNSNLSTALNVGVYTINYNLGNCIITSNQPNIIYSSQTIILEIQPYNNYNLPQYINVTGATYNWDYEEGELTISNATNNVNIQIMAEYKSGQYTMVELLDSVIMVPTNTFYNMFNFELLGVNLYNLLLGALTLLLIIKIYLKVFK